MKIIIPLLDVVVTVIEGSVVLVRSVAVFSKVVVGSVIAVVVLGSENYRKFRVYFLRSYSDNALKTCCVTM